MRRRLFFFGLWFAFALNGVAATSLAGAVSEVDFEGIWVGEIIAPNARTEIGLAFTRAEKGLLVSLNLPEMFLYGVNFGPARIAGATFELAPLNLELTIRGDELVGTFAIAKLPVVLHRGGKFSVAPPFVAYPPAPAARWTHALGAPVWASPVAYEGVVYVGTTEGKFHALRASDGTALWSWTGPHACYGAALATADSVYFLDEASDLIALNRLDGTLRWRTALHGEPTAGAAAPPNETFNHRTASPVIDAKGVLYIGSTDSGLYAVRGRTGKILWRHDARAKIFSAVTLDRDRIIAACYDGSVIVFDPRTQRELQRTPLGGALVSTPVVVRDRIVIGARDYLLYGLDAKTSAVAWRNSYWFSWVESTPRLADGMLYIGGSDYRRVSALEPANGKVRWATDVRGLSWGTPVVAPHAVFAATAGQIIEGTVIEHTGGIAALDRATGTVQWQYVAPRESTGGFTGFIGSLVLVDRILIGARVDGTLMAFPLVE